MTKEDATSKRRCWADSKEEDEESEDDDDDDADSFVMPDELPSLGSANHGDGTCKRCCFFPKGRCQNGYDCEFCHFDHEKRKRKNKKKSKKKKSGGGGSSTFAEEGEFRSHGATDQAS